MVEIKQAVSIAKEFIANLNAELGDLNGLALEEISQTEDGSYWLVTMGFSRQKPSEHTLWPNNQMERVYKTIKVDKQTGEPVAMQIRAV